MSVIIRLQNLPWSANSYDIRSFFQGLSIPEGGVHIVGGELGDAFIAFSTDEDARQAMMRTGGKLKEVQVKLLLSSRNEMEKVIEAARSMTFPVAAAVPIPPAPAPPVVTLASPPVNKERDEESRESRRRSRSRSRDRKGSRRDSRDSGRRRRSRSRDRRRKKSRSRSRDRSSRDRYGRDLEKKVEVKKSSSKEKDKDTRNSRSAAAALGQTPLATNNAMPAGHGLGGDDAISVAMRKTLSALNLPFNMPQADSNAGADPRRGQRDGRNGPRNGPEEPVPPVVPAIADALNIARLTEILRQSQTQAFASNLNVKTDPSQVWLTPSSAINPLAVNPATAIANIAAAAALPNLPLLGGIPPNLLENLRRPGDNSHMGNRMQDSDTRGGDSGGSFGLPRGDSDRFGRFPEQNRFDRPGSFGPGPGFDDPRRDRNNRQLDERPRHGNFDRNSGMDRNRDSHSPDRRRDGNFDRRNDFGGPRRDPRSHGNMNMDFPADANSSNVCIELVGLPACPYSSIRRSLPRRECKVEEIRFKPTANGRRTAIRLASVEAKLEAMALRRVRVDDFFAEIAHLSDAEFNTFDEDRFNQRPEGLGPDNTGNQRDRFEDRRGDPRGDPRDRFNGSRGDVGSNNQDPRSRRNIPDANIIESSECTVMKNLPNGTTDRDLCDFFSDIGLTPRKIHIMLDYNDEPSGEAFIEFWTADQAKLSTTKNGAPIGRNNIEVKLVGREEVEKALAGERPDDFAPNIKAMPMLPDMMMPLGGPGGPGLNGPPPLFPGGIPGGMIDMRPRFGMGFNPRPRFRGPSRLARFPMEGGPAPPPADCTVTMYNIPYRAGTDEIVEFFGPKFDVPSANVFRKFNDHGQPTSEARVVLKTPEEAVEAVKTLANRLIRERPIQLGILGKGDVDYEVELEDQ